MHTGLFLVCFVFVFSLFGLQYSITTSCYCNSLCGGDSLTLNVVPVRTVTVIVFALFLFSMLIGFRALNDAARVRDELGWGRGGLSLIHI